MNIRRFRRWIIGMESSGRIRRAMRALGLNVWSCDILPADDGEKQFHIQDDIRNVDLSKFNSGIFHPPCTDLAVSGARWFPAKIADGSQQRSIDLFNFCVNAPLEEKAIENPIGIMSTKYRRPDQIIQPWQFGHGEVKATCLWLYNLPKLVPTDIVSGRVPRVHRLPPSADRWKLRSETYQGIAEAIAYQWGYNRGGENLLEGLM